MTRNRMCLLSLKSNKASLIIVFLKKSLENMENELFEYDMNHSHFEFNMKSSQNVFNLSEENWRFLRMFQVFGVLPVNLRANEKSFAKIASHALSLFLVILVALKFFATNDKPFLVLLFGYEIIMNFVGQLSTWNSMNQQKTLFKLFGEIDERFKSVLNLRKELVTANLKVQRICVIVMVFYAIGSLYFPVNKAIREGFSAGFFDACSAILTWSFLTQFNVLKYIYFYSIIDVRLAIIKLSLRGIQDDKFINYFFVVKDLSRDKNIKITAKIKAIREIYDRCWELQGLCYHLSGPFLFSVFFGYMGQVLHLAYFFIDESILAGNFQNHLFEICLWLLLINVPTICFFIVSHNLQMKGLRIAGLIHKISLSNINDRDVTQAVTMLSLQIKQQPITAISILGLIAYDKNSLNGVSLKVHNVFFKCELYD